METLNIPDGIYKGVLNGSQITIPNYSHTLKCPFEYAILGKAPVKIIVKNRAVQILEINNNPVPLL